MEGRSHDYTEGIPVVSFFFLFCKNKFLLSPLLSYFMLQLRWRGHDTTLVVRNTIRTADIVSKVVGQGVASSELQCRICGGGEMPQLSGEEINSQMTRFSCRYRNGASERFY